MGKAIFPMNRRVSTELHPLVSVAILGLAFVLILGVWGFAGEGYTDFLLVVVSAFLVAAILIPYVLWRVWRKDHRADARPPSFREWREGEFDTWQDRVKGTNAAIEVLLPIAAVAFGMAAFAIVLYITTHSGI